MKLHIDAEIEGDNFSSLLEAALAVFPEIADAVLHFDSTEVTDDFEKFALVHTSLTYFCIVRNKYISSFNDSNIMSGTYQAGIHYFLIKQKDTGYYLSVCRYFDNLEEIFKRKSLAQQHGFSVEVTDEEDNVL